MLVRKTSPRCSRAPYVRTPASRSPTRLPVKSKNPVVYPAAADNVSRSLPSRLTHIKQPVIASDIGVQAPCSKYNLPGDVGFFQFLRNFRQQNAFGQAELILRAALDPAIATRARRGEFVKYRGFCATDVRWSLCLCLEP